MKDYYKTLGVNQKDSNQKIFKRFKELAYPLHPDNKNSSVRKSKKKFIEYCEAYYVLESDKLRGDYDKIHNRKTNLADYDIEVIIKEWEIKGQESGEEYYSMSYKDFKRTIPQKQSVIGSIFTTILEIVANI